MAKRGFVDVQVNGYMGVSFTKEELTLDEVRRVTLDLSAKGTIAYCPTIVTGSMEMYRKSLAVMAAAAADPELSGHILGVHLEGPFISPEPGAVGAHQQEYVRNPSIEDFDLFWEWSQGNIAILTVAPERPGAKELIGYAAAKGVTVAVGHHLADDASLEMAVAAGARSCTHLGNGLPNTIHRHINPIWWQLACDDLWGTFITDGHHLPPALIKTALRAKTIDRTVIISDAASLAGMPAGRYYDFGKEVVIEPTGRISCAESGGLGGSHSTMLECMNFLASLKLMSETDLWKVGCTNPLKLLGKQSSIPDEVDGPAVHFDGDHFVVEDTKAEG